MTVYGKCGICKQYGKSCSCPDNHVPAAQARKMLAASRKKARDDAKRGRK